MPDDDYRDGGLSFPPPFLFGAASAAYRVEGAAHEGGRDASIWDTFSHTPGRIAGGGTGDRAADHYHRLDADLDVIQRLGLESYSFSIGWARVQPTGAGAANATGLAFYSRLVDGLLARGIRPVATLYSWDLPQALEDAGGWPARDTAYRFADYAALVGETLGDRVPAFVTLSDPWRAAFLGYASGVYAPGRTNGASALAAAHHLNLAHGLALEALRATSSGEPLYGVSLGFQRLLPADEDPEAESEAVRRIDALGHRIFTGPMLLDGYPSDLLEDTASVTDWSFVRPGDLALINQPIDLLGVDYSGASFVREGTSLAARSAHPGSEHVEFVEPRTSAAPAGLEAVLLDLHKRFAELPLLVTVSGASLDEELVAGELHDPRRIDHLQRHLVAVHRALVAGVDVREFHAGPLLDGFEWALGYTKRSGLVRVDFETFERTIKDSGRWLAAVIEGHTLPERR